MTNKQILRVGYVYIEKSFNNPFNIDWESEDKIG